MSIRDARRTASLLTTNTMALDHVKIQTDILKNFVKNLDDPVQATMESFRGDLPDIVSEMEEVQAALAEFRSGCWGNCGEAVGQIVAMFGKSCGLPGSFQGALASVLAHKDDYVTAVRKNILAGGDCSSRALFIGACLGAKLGVEAIPVEWIEKVNGIEKILQDLIMVYSPHVVRLPTNRRSEF